jgi:hypothetical protein
MGNRRSGAEAVVGQEPGDGGLGERRVAPAHRPTAARAGVEVGAKDVGQEPRPTVACCRSSVVRVGAGAFVERRKAELIAARRWRCSLSRVGKLGGYDFATQSAVAREHAKVAKQVHARRGHRRDQACQQVERLEHERARPTH